VFPAFIAIALLALAGTVVLPAVLDASPAARVHLAFSVGIMPLILAAFDYFVPVLTRSGGSSRRARALPWVALAAGLLAFAHFALPDAQGHALSAGAFGAMIAAAASAGWMFTRGSRTVGRPHPCLYWYVAAALCLAAAAAAALAMPMHGNLYVVLKRVHLHLNTLGFVGLTAVGTLQVLMPTVAGRPDAQVADRLRRDLPFAVAGSLLVAAGAAWQSWFAWAGLVAWMVPVTRLAAAWWRLYRREILAWHGSATLLAGALAGFAFMLVAPALQSALHAQMRGLPYVFVLIFLLPLVTGAAAALLPVLLRPGVQTPWHAAFRDTAGRHAGARALLFLSGGAAFALGHEEGVALSLVALVLTLLQIQLAIATRKDSGSSK